MVPTKAAGVSGARQGLEDAIRTLLTALPPDHKGGMSTPPGLGGPLPKANVADSITIEKADSDIKQLLSLRNLLVERLVEKENQANLASTQGSEANVAWAEPSYVTLEPSSKLMRFTTPEVAPCQEERTTPRTNGLHPNSSLHQLSPAEA